MCVDYEETIALVRDFAVKHKAILGGFMERAAESLSTDPEDLKSPFLTLLIETVPDFSC